MPLPRTWVEIDERALVGNIAALKSLIAPGTKFCAVVKANAYGHGQKEVVQIASRNGVDAFAVDHVDDALALRRLLPSALLIVLGYTLQDRLEEAVAERLHLTVYDPETIQRLESIAAKRATTAFLHLKIETGTARQGVLLQTLPDILDLLRRSPHLKLAGVSTHFANIEDTTDTRFATQQLGRFHEAVETIKKAGFDPEWVHSACSAAIILYPDTYGTLVRAGIALYGLWPSSQTELTARQHMIKCPLTPVLTWKTRVAQIKTLPAGTPIGYGLTEALKRQSRIAVVPVGYWDGYDRKLSSVGEVLVSGHRCKVMGRICMNMMMIDVSDVPKVAPEHEVVLLGRSGRHAVPAEELAEKIGTIPYEVVTRINPLLPRVIAKTSNGV
jgi:alanine racemase